MPAQNPSRTVRLRLKLASKVQPDNLRLRMSLDPLRTLSRGALEQLARVLDVQHAASPTVRTLIAKLRARATEGSLLAAHPLVAAEWHPTKNHPLTPADVVPGTARRVVWRCLRDPSHVWAAPVRGRLKSRGCPICSGRVVGLKTSLAARYPALAARWHPTKNGRQTPQQVLPKSSKKAWWRCPKEPRHIFLAAVCAVVVAHASGTTGCPWCAGKKVDPWRSLASLAPRVAREWHPSENGSLTARDVSTTSGRRVAWLCRNCSHVWRASVDHRARRGHGCPACAGKVATAATSLAGRFSALAAEWHPTKNGELTPRDVTPGATSECGGDARRRARMPGRRPSRSERSGDTGAPSARTSS